MATTIPRQAHCDHLQWESEAAMWRDDIEKWRQEHEAGLLALNEAIVQHHAALGNHLDTIKHHEAQLAATEHRLAEDERTLQPAMGAIARSLDGPHEEEAGEQDLLRATHERIKRHHYTTMAKVGVLAKALGSEM